MMVKLMALGCSTLAVFGCGDSEGYTTGREVFCVESPNPNDLTQSTADLRRLYFHYEMCEENYEISARMLDELIRRNDPDAMHRKAVSLYVNHDNADDVEALALMRKSAALGYEPAQRAMAEWDKTGRF